MDRKTAHLLTTARVAMPSATRLVWCTASLGRELLESTGDVKAHTESKPLEINGLVVGQQTTTIHDDGSADWSISDSAGNVSGSAHFEVISNSDGNKSIAGTLTGIDGTQEKVTISIKEQDGKLAVELNQSIDGPGGWSSSATISGDAVDGVDGISQWDVHVQGPTGPPASGTVTIDNLSGKILSATDDLAEGDADEGSADKQGNTQSPGSTKDDPDSTSKQQSIDTDDELDSDDDSDDDSETEDDSTSEAAGSSESESSSAAKGENSSKQNTTESSTGTQDGSPQPTGDGKDAKTQDSKGDGGGDDDGGDNDD